MDGGPKQANQTLKDASSQRIEAVQQRKKVLQQNPFQTYRDPETGRWVVEKFTASAQPSL